MSSNVKMKDKQSGSSLWEKFVCVALDINEGEYKKGKKIKWKKEFGYTTVIGIIFVLPALLSNLIFDWVPVLDGIIKSFFTWTKKDPEPVFVGFENFARIFNDSQFYASLQNMFFFLVVNLILMVPTIICCVVLFRIKSTKSQYTYRILLCLQMVIPSLVFTLMWIFILGYDFGAINNVIESLGFNKISFLGDPSIIKWTIILTGVPFVSANTTLIYLGGLNSIGDSVWEAAKMDGCGPIRKFFALELPLITGQFKLNLIGVIGASITAYGQQLIYYNTSVHEGIMTPGLLMYFKAFPNAGSPDYGYSYALGLILFLVSLTISMMTMKYIKSEE